MKWSARTSIQYTVLGVVCKERMQPLSVCLYAESLRWWQISIPVLVPCTVQYSTGVVWFILPEYCSTRSTLLLKWIYDWCRGFRWLDLEILLNCYALSSVWSFPDTKKGIGSRKCIYSDYSYGSTVRLYAYCQLAQATKNITTIARTLLVVSGVGCVVINSIRSNLSNSTE
jgi:hypothetical protein